MDKLAITFDETPDKTVTVLIDRNEALALIILIERYLAGEGMDDD